MISALAPYGDSQNSAGTPEVSGGLRTVTLATPRGDIKVSLPDDLNAGDTISGTVVAEPKGKDEKERKSNLDRLEDGLAGPRRARLWFTGSA